jgi:hypothetical protein
LLLEKLSVLFLIEKYGRVSELQIWSLAVELTFFFDPIIMYIKYFINIDLFIRAQRERKNEQA